MTINGIAWNPNTEVLLADGAWGTEFLKRGLAQGEAPDAWNLTRRADVLAVARAYVQAGSRIVLTNTFGASRIQLERHGLAGQAREINRVGAAISAEAAAGRAMVAGDIGPCGKLFIMGEVEEAALYEAFAEQADALKAGGAAMLVVETMTDMGEMEIAVRAAAATGLPVVSSMTYEKGAAGYRTVMGHAPADCVAAAVKAGAAIVGANCGSGIDAYVELAVELRGLTDRPLWIKANAGLPELAGGRTVYRMSPAGYCSHLRPLLEAGVGVVGGCCGTSPEFIAAMKTIVDAWNQRSTPR